MRQDWETLVSPVYMEGEVLQRVNFWRGLVAVLLIVGHASIMLPSEPLLFFLIHKFNGVIVCYFFFISGWGLSYNMDNREHYLRSIIRSKIAFLFCVAILYTVVWGIAKAIAYDNSVYLFYRFFSRWNWYIYEALFFYICFCIVHYFFHNPKIVWVLMVLLTTLLCIGMLWVWKNTDWYIRSRSYFTSAYSFVWGMFIHLYYERFVVWIRKKPLVFIATTFGGALVALSSYLFPEDSFLWGCLVRNAIGIFLMTALVGIMVYVNTMNGGKISRILNKLSQISLEIYLYQMVVFEVLQAFYYRRGIPFDYWYMIASLVLTLILAVFMKYPDKLIKKVLQNV